MWLRRIDWWSTTKCDAVVGQSLRPVFLTPKKLNRRLSEQKGDGAKTDGIGRPTCERIGESVQASDFLRFHVPLVRVPWVDIKHMDATEIGEFIILLLFRLAFASDQYQLSTIIGEQCLHHTKSRFGIRDFLSAT